MAGGTSQNMDVDGMNLNSTDLMQVDNPIDEREGMATGHL